MANFLQLNDPNILNQTRNMSWGQALQTENPFSKNYQGYNPSYKGADKTSLRGYAKQGLESLKGNFVKGSNVGGATPLTRKLALGVMDHAPKALGVASKFLGPLSFLFDTSAVADATMPEFGSEEYKALMAREALFKRKQKQADVFKKIKEKQLADAAAKAKADAAAAAKATSSFDPSGPTQASIRRDRADKSGRGHSGGFTNPGKGSYGPHKADGGLINFYKYGGFI